MNDRSASFSFNFSDGTLQIEGSELFVAQQVEAFRDNILEALAAAATQPVAIAQIPDLSREYRPENTEDTEPEKGNQSESFENPYPKVLDVMNGRLKVTAVAKGRNTAEKAINLILAYLWGKEKLLFEPTATYKELRDLCEEHACLDSSNFSSTLNSKKHLVLVDGAKGSSSKECKLTYPGREAATEVLSQLSGD